MTRVGGWERDASGGLALTTDATGAKYAGGFLRTPDGKVVVVSGGAGSWKGGFLRDASGKLVVADGAAGSWQGGFIRDSAGRLCTSQVPAGAVEKGGFMRDSAGRLLVSGLTVAAPFSPGVLALAPALYWRLGDAVGSGSVADASGNGRTGTPSAGVTLGAAGLLTGDSDTAALVGGGNITSAFGPFSNAGQQTYLGWASAADFAAGRWLFGGDGGQPPTLSVDSATSVTLGTNAGGSANWVIPALAIGTAFMWAVVVNQAAVTAELFINGISKGSKAFHAWGATPGNFLVGNRVTGAASWQGTEDEVAVWTSALTAAQILDLYQRGTKTGAYA